MRKIIVIIILAYSIQVSAQKYGGGLEGGFIYSWFFTDSKKASTEAGRFNFVYGVFMDKNLTDNFTFSTGLNILGTGGDILYAESIKMNTTDGLYTLDPNSKVSYRLRYLETPFSIKGRTQEIGYITYFAKVGVSPMLLIQSRADIEGHVLDNNDAPITDIKMQQELNIKNDINFFNIGFHIGGGIEYSLGGSTAIIAELLYTNNFLDVTKDKKDYNNQISVTNGMVVFKAGIKF